MGSKDGDARAAWESMSRLFFSGERHDRFHEACAHLGLPHPGSLRALLWIDASDPPPMRSLADGMHCDASYITGLVDALEGLGLVERRPATRDRRMKLVALTDAGRLARTRALEILQAPPASLDVLSADEIRTLARLLAKVAASYPPLAAGQPVSPARRGRAR